MPIIQHEVILQQPESAQKTDHKATLITWKGQKMIRIHSLRATVNEILQMFSSLDVVKVGIIGDTSTGKTTLAETIAHLAHKMSKIPFAFRIFGEDEFLDMKATVNALEPVNYILYFHDLSFLINKRAIEEVKNVVTKIRHLKKDVKILLVYDYHYTLGLDKYLRQANFRYFTSLGSSEKENMIKIVGSRYLTMIEDFQEKYVEMTTSQKCTFKFPENKFFIYNYKKPFVTCLFYNESRLRYIIFPKREWIDPICSICSFAHQSLMHSEIPIPQMCIESEGKFGEQVWKQAVKIVLMQNGINTYARSTMSAIKYLYRALEKKEISLEDIATHYGYTITKIRLTKILDGVLSEKQEIIDTYKNKEPEVKP